MIHSGVPSKHSDFWRSQGIDGLQSIYKMLTASPKKVIGMCQLHLVIWSRSLATCVVIPCNVFSDSQLLTRSLLNSIDWVAWGEGRVPIALWSSLSHIATTVDGNSQ